ncbi:hypothetical protein N7501_011808 [Penicillium viridicatum]|nr:hypothetical protein N7501_011808 [Penicillium viridicatum]
MATTNAQDSYQGSYRAGTIAMTVLGVLFLLARWKKSLKPGRDDYMIMASLLPLLALVGLMLALTPNLGFKRRVIIALDAAISIGSAHIHPIV